MSRIVLALSGGLDSTTLLGHFLDEGHEVIPVVFYYGSKHNLRELEATVDILSYYNAHSSKFSINKTEAHAFDLSKVFEKCKSNLIQGQGEIPEGHYEDDNMKQTVVPGRNLIFASILASVAESEGADTIALGVHTGDHHIYPDCRPRFVKALDEVIRASTDDKVKVICTFSLLDKADILRIGNALNPPVPYELTRTCYTDGELACGKCGSCNERLEAFKKIGMKDPINYA
jgi:7-cyano-7-deazaguanine synthase